MLIQKLKIVYKIQTLISYQFNYHHVMHGVWKQGEDMMQAMDGLQSLYIFVSNFYAGAIYHVGTFYLCLENMPNLSHTFGDFSLLLAWWLEMQKDNVSNQREHIVHLLSNAQVRLGIPDEAEPVSCLNKFLNQNFFFIKSLKAVWYLFCP